MEPSADRLDAAGAVLKAAVEQEGRRASLRPASFLPGAISNDPRMALTALVAGPLQPTPYELTPVLRMGWIMSRRLGTRREIAAGVGGQAIADSRSS